MFHLISKIIRREQIKNPEGFQIDDESELRAVYRRLMTPGKSDLLFRSFPNSLRDRINLEAEKRHLSTAVDKL